MATRWKLKDPNDIADYWFDWADTEAPFLPEAEPIIEATVTIPAEGDQPAAESPFALLTKVTDDFTDTQVRVRLAGGMPGNGYAVDCLITTSTGQQFEMTHTLQVKERAK